MFFLFVLKYNRTIKKGVTSQERRILCYLLPLCYQLFLGVLLMTKYFKCEVSSHFIEQKRITITNRSKIKRLCKVMVNHKLFKILLLAPNEKETLVYEKQEDIEIIEMTDLTESEENK
jgi:hypothetical protein